MTKRLASIISVIVGCAAAYYFSQSFITKNLAHTYWVQVNVPGSILPTPEQDRLDGIRTGVGLGAFLGLILWLALRAMVPIDMRRSIGKAVIDEAVENVKDSLPLPKAVEEKSRAGFWDRLNGIIGR